MHRATKVSKRWRSHSHFTFPETTMTLMATWKFAPAMAEGNSVILKLAGQSPLTGILTAELAAEAGIKGARPNFVRPLRFLSAVL